VRLRDEAARPNYSFLNSLTFVYFAYICRNLNKNLIAIIMQTYKIELLDPRAKQLLEELAKLNLIKVTAISDTDTEADKAEMLKLLTKIQAKPELCPTEDEITAEVEAVRAARYKKNKKIKNA
jgi:hypothetical protein